MNRESSRAHAVFTLTLEAKEDVPSTVSNGLKRSRLSRFYLVDLAGSERQSDTKTHSHTLREAGHINKSLSTLG